MAVTLSRSEQDKYERIWALDAYAAMSPGLTYLPLFLDMAKPDRMATILDAGCGSGKAGVALHERGFDVTLCDLTAAGLTPAAHALPFVEAVLWESLRESLPMRPTLRSDFVLRKPFDWVYCCDVLEHIPPTFAMLVVARLLEVASRGVFLSISFMPDDFGAWIGTPLHQTIQPYPLWVEQLSAIGHLRESRDLLHSGVFLLEPRTW